MTHHVFRRHSRHVADVGELPVDECSVLFNLDAPEDYAARQCRERLFPDVVASTRR
jgi:hypothetical protein